MSLHFIGLADFRKRAERILAQQRRARRQASAEAARRVAGIARDLAPVESGVGRSGIVARGSVVVSTEQHMIYQEIGTEHLPAQPHLRPAAERAHGDVTTIFASNFRASLK